MCLCRSKKKRDWFDACKRNDTKTVIQLFRSEVCSVDLQKSRRDVELGFTGAMYCCCLDNADVLRVIFAKEFRIVSKFYFTVKTFRLPPNSNLLQFAIATGSLRCAAFIVEKMR